jgi:large subunit ribosomal protein L29
MFRFSSAIQILLVPNIHGTQYGIDTENMKASDLRQKSKEELKDLLREKRARVDELRWQLAQKKMKNVKELSVVKKDIARILTLLRE